jgi:ApeA N-terminal domain 1
MTDHALNTPIKTVGDWFVPEEPVHRVSGILEYDGQVSLLTLADSFEPVIDKVTAGHAKRYRVVHGATIDLGAVSLFDAVQMGLGFNIVQGQLTQPERLRATVLIIGRHVDPDALIKSMTFRIPGLEVWLSQRVILSAIAPPTKESRASQTVHIVSPCSFCSIRRVR